MTAAEIAHALKVALIGFAASAVAAPLIYKTLIKVGSRQTVSEFVPEHGAKQGTPTMGGLIMVVGMLAALAASNDPSNQFTAFLVLCYALIGFLDDFLIPRMMPGKRGLGWIPKLAMQFVPFVVMWAVMPLVPIWVIGVTAFTVLFFANAYNFADGMDGMAGGIGVILAIGLILLTFASAPSGVALTHIPLLLALVMSFVPFLYLNAPPAKMFMGDVGSLPIGAFLGMAYLQSTLFVNPATPDWNKVWWSLPLLVVLLVEIVPGPLQIASAKLRKGKRLFPFKTPVHHGFQAAGWPETRVVSLFVLTQFVLAALAVGLGFWVQVSGKS